MASKRRRAIEGVMPSKKKGKPKTKTNEIETKRDAKGHVIVTKETVHPTSGTVQKPPKGGWSGTESVGTHRPRKTKTKTKKPVVATKTNGSPKTTPPVKKGVRGSTIAGAALIGSGAGLIGYTGPLVYNEMMRKKSHKVKSGDTLSQIAKRHGTTLKALLAANPKIEDANKIRVGQRIKLSRPVKGRKSVYQGMSKSAMAKMAKKKSGKVVKKAGGGMTRVGLSPAEMARAGTMSEAKRKRYMAKGGLVKRKHAGKVGPKEQGYDARKDEQLGMTQGKESSKKMSMKGRRKVARATRKPKGSFGFKKKRADEALVHAQYS